MEMDFILNGQANGSVAQKLVASGMNTNALRPYIGKDGRPYITFMVNGKPVAKPIVGNATLRKDEWKHYDTAVIKAAQERLVAVADLQSRGLTYNIPNGMGTTVLEYEDMSDTEPASLSMDGITRGEADRPEFDINYLPLPIIHKDFFINARVLASSRTTGAPLDTTMAELAGRKVAEKAEEMLMIGASSYAFGGGTLYGYMDFTHRGQYTLAVHWNDSGATGDTILADVIGMKQASIDDRYYGPWMIYIPTNFETAIDADFKAASDKTIRQRLLEVDGIQGIKVVDKLTDDNIVMVQMTSDVIRIVNGMAITVVEWESEGGMRFHFKVMAIIVPQPRADQDDRCGIIHATK